MMVNNSTNINECFTPLIIEQKKSPLHMVFENPGPALGQAQNCCGIKPINVITIPPLDN